MLYNTHKDRQFVSECFFWYRVILGNYYYDYYIRLTAFFQDSLGKLAPER